MTEFHEPWWYGRPPIAGGSPEGDDLETEVQTPEAETPESDDLDGLRRALDHERSNRREAREELQRLREDAEHRNKWLTELGYEFQSDEDDDDDDFEDDDQNDLSPQEIAALRKELSEIKTWRDGIDSERGTERFNRDLSKFAGEREVGQQGKDWILFQTTQNGNNPQALEKAVKAWFEFEDQLAATARKKYLDSKRAPNTPPGPGGPGDESFDRKKATPAQRREQRQARMAAALAAEDQG